MPDIQNFTKGERVVYPSHGVGTIVDLESQEIGDRKIELFVISLEKDNMILRVPIKRADAVGLRSLSTKKRIDQVFDILQSKPRATRGMWSKRAQAYEAKINSGDIILISEVIRDLHKNVDDPDRSYSERVIYETALERLVCEYSAVEQVTKKQAREDLVSVLNDREVAA